MRRYAIELRLWIEMITVLAEGDGKMIVLLNKTGCVIYRSRDWQEHDQLEQSETNKILNIRGDDKMDQGCEELVNKILDTIEKEIINDKVTTQVQLFADMHDNMRKRVNHPLRFVGASCAQFPNNISRVDQ